MKATMKPEKDRIACRQSRTTFVAAMLMALLMASAAFADDDDKTPDTNGYPALKDAVILIIRHAEKTASGDELSPDGYKRANAYVNYFKNYQVDGKSLKIDYLYAAADSKNSKRVRLTVEPLSKATGLKLDNRFANKKFQGMVDELHATSHGHEILICWHHGQIANMLVALGVDPATLLPKAKWPDDVFNWVLELHYDDNGRLIPSQTKRINENLMPGDAAQASTAAK
ncbi:MAG TPA: flagellar basal body-associated protein FliL [Verrucomicrobiae bacterium]|nr:flagellar basal body-associated protein FliL [Verrucomicrobiae bacterium]